MLCMLLGLGACTAPAPDTTGAAGSNASNAPSAEPGGKAPGTQSIPVSARLSGLSESELRAALGDPTLLRREGSAQLWQYAGIGCVLHVFLYDNHGAYRVTYSEVHIQDPEVANPPTCVDWKADANAKPVEQAQPRQPAPPQS